MVLTDLTQLKYQANPKLIIEECMRHDDPIEEIKDCLMALKVFGLEDLSAKVIGSLNQYGLKLDNLIYEIYV